VFAEAALCLLALVGTNVGGIAEQIEDGVNGLLVPPDNPEALAGALEKVISDPSYRYNLARAAWQKAKRDYSLHRVIAQLKEVYLGLAQKADDGPAGREATPDGAAEAAGGAAPEAPRDGAMDPAQIGAAEASAEAGADVAEEGEAT